MSVDLFAQGVFDLSMQLRNRLEVRRGYRTLPAPASDPAVFISQRSRLNAAYQQDIVKVYVSLQDVRVWGEERQLADIPSLALHEAWAKVKLCDSISLKLGRQELKYDDHRLLGNVNWTQQARSHDAAVLMVKSGRTRFHAGGAFNQSGERLFENYDYSVAAYKALAYLWAQHRFKGDKSTLSLYGIMDGYNADASLMKEKVFMRGTAGPMFQYKSRKITVAVSEFMQFGKNSMDATISAFFASASVSYQTKKVTATAGLDYMTGNDASDTSSTDDKRFNTLYATNHKFYGHMDYFLNVPADAGGGGLQDAYLKIKIKPGDKSTVGFDFHHFMLTNNVHDPANPGDYLDKALGFEVDAYGSYKASPIFTVVAGYSAMFGTESLAAIKGGSEESFAGWGWVMVNIALNALHAEK